MQNHKSQLEKNIVEVLPKNIDILFNDNGVFPLVLSLPSAKELSELHKNIAPHISFAEIAQKDPLGLFESLISDKDLLQEKYGDFHQSSTYLTRLANVNELLGNLESSEEYIGIAKDIDDDPFLVHEYGNILIKQKKYKHAKEVFLGCNLSSDLYSNLRLAYLATSENDIATAVGYVQNALTIDPINYMARMFHGALELSQSNWEHAIRSFKIAEEENSNSSPLYVNLAAAYWALGNTEKAILSLKKATYINPVNENAVAFLSDLLFIIGDGECSLRYLKRYIEYEQKSEAMWGRVARAYYVSGQKNQDNERVYYLKAKEALKNQCKLKPSSSVWNNIAVVYWALGENGKAQRFFSQAISESEGDTEDSVLALYNLIGLLIDNKHYTKALKLIVAYLSELHLHKIDSVLTAKIYLKNVICLEALGRHLEASKIASKVILMEDIEPETKVDMLSHLIYFYSAIKPDYSYLSQIIPLALKEISTAKMIPDVLVGRVINNMTFAYLLFDKVDDASFLISRLGKYFHKDPYATATLGLYSLKNGNFNKGKTLYEESLSLVKDVKEKSRFKQRMFFELGKFKLHHGAKKEAEKLFKKAMKQKDSSLYINKEIQLLQKF